MLSFTYMPCSSNWTFRSESTMCISINPLDYTVKNNESLSCASSSVEPAPIINSYDRLTSHRAAAASGRSFEAISQTRLGRAQERRRSSSRSCSLTTARNLFCGCFSAARTFSSSSFCRRARFVLCGRRLESKRVFIRERVMHTELLHYSAQKERVTATAGKKLPYSPKGIFLIKASVYSVNCYSVILPFSPPLS